jgi:hypothetical protein
MARPGRRTERCAERRLARHLAHSERIAPSVPHFDLGLPAGAFLRNRSFDERLARLGERIATEALDHVRLDVTRVGA